MIEWISVKSISRTANTFQLDLVTQMPEHHSMVQLNRYYNIDQPHLPAQIQCIFQGVKGKKKKKKRGVGGIII